MGTSKLTAEGIIDEAVRIKAMMSGCEFLIRIKTFLPIPCTLPQRQLSFFLYFTEPLLHLYSK